MLRGSGFSDQSVSEFCGTMCAGARESRDCDAQGSAASEAARVALADAGAAVLHPLAKATQVKHVLGSALTRRAYLGSPGK